MTTAVKTDSSETTAVAIPRHRRTRERHEARTGWIFMLPFVLGFTLVFLLPIGASVYSSFFQEVSDGGGLYGGSELVKEFVGLENYYNTVANDRFWLGILRVILYTLIQVPVMIFVGLALALVLDSMLVRHVGIYRLGYFLPFAIPGIVAAIIWLYIYTPEISPLVSVLNWFGLDVDFMSKNIIFFSMANMTTWTYTGYNMLIFLAALQAIPAEVEEAARLDGATGFQVVTKVKVPMVRGAVLLSVLLSIVGTIQLFNEPAVLSTVNRWMGADYTPMMMAYNTMIGQITPSGDGPAAATSIVMAVIAGVLAVAYALIEKKVND